MSKALYRKYRSKSLNDVVGQDHITSILSKSLQKGRVAHAYLLTGPRGVGKTSIARILAHEINGLPYTEDSNHLDIIEIDAASNNGVDDVRDLRDKAQITPVSAKKKIYIIDEVHMLSKAAFNALLKTLEEPPEHIVFILATTDADKLPATIISRAQQFHFRAIAPNDAANHLAAIAKEEGIKIEKDALQILAERGRGSFRDSIGMLDQLAGLAGDDAITAKQVEEVLGLAPKQLIQSLLTAYKAKDIQTILTTLNEADASGVSSKVLASQLIQTIRILLSKDVSFLPLLDDLLNVEKSSHPDIKLLTVLAKADSYSTQPAAPSKSAALAVSLPQPVVAAAPDELKTPLSQPATPAKQVAAKKTPAPATPTVVATPVAEAQPNRPTVALDALDWPALIETARTNFVAVYSMLSKCKHDLQEGRLIIYTGSAFYKKKLDDPKHRINIAKALELNGHTDVSIEIIGSPMPPKDSTLAAVAAIMGGGEEVQLEEQPA